MSMTAQWQILEVVTKIAWSACMLSHSVMSDSMQPNGLPLPVSSVHGIHQTRILEWVAIPSSRESSQPRDQTQVSHITGGFYTI